MLNISVCCQNARKENFYSQQNAFVDEIRKGDIKIPMGNFNAKVDFGNSDYEHATRRYGFEEMSENGCLFAVFCGNNDMPKKQR